MHNPSQFHSCPAKKIKCDDDGQAERNSLQALDMLTCSVWSLLIRKMLIQMQMQMIQTILSSNLGTD